MSCGGHGVQSYFIYLWLGWVDVEFEVVTIPVAHNFAQVFPIKGLFLSTLFSWEISPPDCSTNIKDICLSTNKDKEYQVCKLQTLSCLKTQTQQRKTCLDQSKIHTEHFRKGFTKNLLIWAFGWPPSPELGPCYHIFDHIENDPVMKIWFFFFSQSISGMEKTHLGNSNC